MLSLVVNAEYIRIVTLNQWKPQSVGTRNNALLKNLMNITKKMETPQ